MTTTLFHDDCFNILPHIKAGSVDMVLVDMPYGTTTCKWDTVLDLELMWENLKKVCKPSAVVVFTASQPFTTVLISSNLKAFKYELIWEKSHPSAVALAKYRPLKYHENICIFNTIGGTYNPQMWAGKESHSRGNQIGHENLSESNCRIIQKPKDYGTVKHPKSIYKCSNPRIRGGHPTQKPVALMEYLIKTYSNERDVVLDFCMGSGTTGVACQNLNRDFTGIEIEEQYFNIAKERLGV